MAKFLLTDTAKYSLSIIEFFRIHYNHETTDQAAEFSDDLVERAKFNIGQNPAQYGLSILAQTAGLMLQDCYYPLKPYHSLYRVIGKEEGEDVIELVLFYRDRQDIEQLLYLVQTS